MISKKQILNFKKRGFVKIKCLDKIKLENLKNQFSKMIEISIKKNFPTKKIKFKSKNKKNDYLLNEGMIMLEKRDHKNLSLLYDQIVRSTSFYDIICDKKITSIINSLLGRSHNSNLYMNSSAIRMDIPGLTKFVYGWHQDSKSNIKNSNFIQLWLPPFYNINQKLGGLHILENSFKHDIKTSHTTIEIDKLKANLPLRASHNVKIFSKSHNFKEKILTCNLGEVIFFSKWLMHKSGINKSRNKMRYILSTFYHDIYNPKWKFISLDHKSK